LWLKITRGLAPSYNFLATNTCLSGLLEKISGNISVPWYTGCPKIRGTT
jgi:hypothetical protein